MWLVLKKLQLNKKIKGCGSKTLTCHDTGLRTLVSVLPTAHSLFINASQLTHQRCYHEF